jgi:predicted DNA-binding transcriptional regulator AlpA
MQADTTNKPPGRLVRNREFAAALGVTTRSLFTWQKTDPEFPPVVRIGGRRFFAEEHCEQYRQTLIRRSMLRGGNA